MIAEAFRDWLPYVLNEVEPWMSSEDIKKGTRWAAELGERLSNTEFALLFVTPENQFAPWLVFEAGALSNSLGGAVATVLLDIDTDDLIASPLGQFQDTKLSREDIFRLVESMNARLSWRHPESRLRQAFEVWWERLEEKIGEAWHAKIQQPSLLHPQMLQDVELPEAMAGRAYRLRFPQWLEELARAIKAPPRSVKTQFRVVASAVPELERLLANRSCPAHPRFVTITKSSTVDGTVLVEATACCRFALLVARDYVRDLVS